MKSKLNKALFTALVLVLLTGVVGYYRKSIIVARVNNTFITRLALWTELEKQNRKQAVESLIIKTLILQEAKKAKLVVTPKDIDAEMAKIEQNLKAQNMTLDKVYELQGITEASLRENILLQKYAEALVSSSVTVTDEEVKAELESQKTAAAADPKAPVSTEEIIREDLRQQKLSKAIQDLLTKLRGSDTSTGTAKIIVY